jgi:hypothetical protein
MPMFVVQSLFKGDQWACHSAPCCWELSPKTNESTKWYCGSLQGLLTTTKRKQSGILMRTVTILHMSRTRCTPYDGRCCTIPHTAQTVRFPSVRPPQESAKGPQICVAWRHKGWIGAVVPVATQEVLCIGRSIDWPINGMPTSMPTGDYS